MNAVPNAQVWHRRLGHLHAPSLDVLRKRDGTGITFEGPVSDCDGFAAGKAQKLPHPKTANRKANRPFQLCYKHLMVTFMPVAIGGYKYASKVTDGCTKWTAVYLLNNKNRARQLLQLFVESMSIHFGGRIVRWRADKGGEYTGEEFWQYCLETSIIQEFAVTNTQQKTGESERVGWVLRSMVRCMLTNSSFPSSMWRELLMVAVYLKNRAPYEELKMETTLKMLHGEKVDLSHLWVTEARTFVRESITVEWRGNVARNRGIFAAPCAGYSEKRDS